MRQHKTRVGVKQFNKPSAAKGAKVRATRKAQTGREQRNEQVERKRSTTPQARQPQQAATAPPAAESKSQSMQEQQREAALRAERARFTNWAAEKRAQQSHRAGSEAKPKARQPAVTPSVAPSPPPKTVELSEGGRNRVEERVAELREMERMQEQQSNERARLQREIGPVIQRRLGHLTYLQLCQRVNPSCSLTDDASKDEVRKMLKKTMKMYHPDQNLQLELRQRIEAEEIFYVLQNAYKELA